MHPTIKWKQFSRHHCILYFKRKFVLMYHKISLHEENSILYLPTPNLICFDSSEKVQFLPSLHTLLQKKIHFDASQNVPRWRKHYSCNHFIQYRIYSISTHSRIKSRMHCFRPAFLFPLYALLLISTLISGFRLTFSNSTRAY